MNGEEIVKRLESDKDFQSDLKGVAYEAVTENNQREVNKLIAMYGESILSEIGFSEYQITTTQHAEKVIISDKNSPVVYQANNDGLDVVEEAYFGVDIPDEDRVGGIIISKIINRIMFIMNSD